MMNDAMRTTEALVIAAMAEGRKAAPIRDMRTWGYISLDAAAGTYPDYIVVYPNGTWTAYCKTGARMLEASPELDARRSDYQPCATFRAHAGLSV